MVRLELSSRQIFVRPSSRIFFRTGGQNKICPSSISNGRIQFQMDEHDFVLKISAYSLFFYRKLYSKLHETSEKYDRTNETSVVRSKSKSVKFTFIRLFGQKWAFKKWCPFDWKVAFLMTRYGWVYAFYVPAVLALFVAVLWFYIVSNSPHSHPRISDHELKFIEASQGNSVAHSKVKTFISIVVYYLQQN